MNVLPIFSLMSFSLLLSHEPNAAKLYTRPHNTSVTLPTKIITTTNPAHSGIAIAILDIDNKGKIRGQTWRGGTLNDTLQVARQNILPKQSPILIASKKAIKALPNIKFTPQRSCANNICQNIPSYSEQVFLYITPNSERKPEKLYFPSISPFSYPKDAENNLEEGVAEISLIFNAQGIFEQAQLSRSSGSDSLNRTALKIAQKIGKQANIIPKIQQGKAKEKNIFILPILFNLNN